MDIPNLAPIGQAKEYFGAGVALIVMMLVFMAFAMRYILKREDEKQKILIDVVVKNSDSNNKLAEAVLTQARSDRDSADNIGRKLDMIAQEMRK